jgi:hypothetical protein
MQNAIETESTAVKQPTILMNFKIDPELKKNFAQTCKARRSQMSPILVHLIQDFVIHQQLTTTTTQATASSTFHEFR